MATRRLSFFSALTILLPTLCFSSEQETLVETSFEAWSVFVEEDVCWMSSHVTTEQGLIRKDIYYHVTFHYNQPRPYNSIFSEMLLIGTKDAILSSSKKDYTFDQIGDTAFPKVADEISILKELLSEKALQVLFSFEHAPSFTAILNTAGFKNAYNYASKNCAFHPSGKLKTLSGNDPA